MPEVRAVVPNKNYVNGRSKEYREAAKLREQGFEVLRTAGSHGFADLIAIRRPPVGVIYFVQVKKGELSPKAKADLMAVLKTYEGTYRVSAGLID